MSYQASIVVPLLQQVDEWLEQSIRSALEQTVTTEVLVIIASNTPLSNRAVLNKLGCLFDNLKVLERPQGTRFAGAINYGFTNACTERIGLLLSDDFLAPNAIACALQFPVDLVSSGRSAVDGLGENILWQRIPTSAQFHKLTSLEQKASYLGHFFVFSRKKFIAVGGVDPDIGHTGPDDYDLIWTLLEQNASVAVLEKPLYFYRDHHNQRLTLRNQQDQIADLTKILTKHGITGRQQKRLIRQKKKWYGEPCYQVLARMK